ncbi:hypothetical protein RSOLAG22IIIB_13375 [Rhizoctonia solani]|uniref:Uncharacterized protein n=1 Tax=Rhizoctonia solani TaxID=456999 RepID=A0A0K6FMS9_9AGAM|nr:hypothetical protein RSOLAG22IIIB_13375 [Rhizoctonia solani]
MLLMELVPVLDGESFILHDGMARVWCVQTVVKNAIGSRILRTWHRVLRDLAVSSIQGQVRQGPGYGLSHGLYGREQGQGGEPPHYQSYSAPHQLRN